MKVSWSGESSRNKVTSFKKQTQNVSKKISLTHYNKLFIWNNVNIHRGYYLCNTVTCM